jgi:hypothetical protein
MGCSRSHTSGSPLLGERGFNNSEGRTWHPSIRSSFDKALREATSDMLDRVFGGPALSIMNRLELKKLVPF